MNENHDDRGRFSSAKDIQNAVDAGKLTLEQGVKEALKLKAGAGLSTHSSMHQDLHNQTVAAPLASARLNVKENLDPHSGGDRFAVKENIEPHPFPTGQGVDKFGALHVGKRGR